MVQAVPAVHQLAGGHVHLHRHASLGETMSRPPDLGQVGGHRVVSGDQGGALGGQEKLVEVGVKAFHLADAGNLSQSHVGNDRLRHRQARCRGTGCPGR